MLAANQFCAYAEPKIGRKSVWDWLRSSFADDACRAAFMRALHAVVVRACDPRDRQIICLGDIPSGTSQQTRAPYSGAEVAAWWNEVAQRVSEIRAARPAPSPVPQPAITIAEEDGLPVRNYGTQPDGRWVPVPPIEVPERYVPMRSRSRKRGLFDF